MVGCVDAGAAGASTGARAEEAFLTYKVAPFFHAVGNGSSSDSGPAARVGRRLAALGYLCGHPFKLQPLVLVEFAWQCAVARCHPG